MKKLIKWAYFQYVYPDNVVRAYEATVQPVFYETPQEALIAVQAMAERPANDRLH